MRKSKQGRNRRLSAKKQFDLCQSIKDRELIEMGVLDLAAVLPYLFDEYDRGNLSCPIVPILFIGKGLQLAVGNLSANVIDIAGTVLHFDPIVMSLIFDLDRVDYYGVMFKGANVRLDARFKNLVGFDFPNDWVPLSHLREGMVELRVAIKIGRTAHQVPALIVFGNASEL